MSRTQPRPAARLAPALACTLVLPLAVGCAARGAAPVRTDPASPQAHALRTALCGSAAEAATALVVGRVRQYPAEAAVGGTPLVAGALAEVEPVRAVLREAPGARVEVRWSDRGVPARAVVRAARDGTFHVCGVPAGARVAVQLVGPSGEGAAWRGRPPLTARARAGDVLGFELVAADGLAVPGGAAGALLVGDALR